MTQTYYEKTREQHLARSKEWNKNNKDKCKGYMKKYIDSVRPHINAYNAKIKRTEYYTDDRKRMRAILLASHKLFIEGLSDSLASSIGMSPNEYIAYIKTLLPEGCDMSNYGKKWQIRRTLGIKDLDLLKAEDKKKFMSYKNIYIYEINKKPIK